MGGGEAREDRKGKGEGRVFGGAAGSWRLLVVSVEVGRWGAVKFGL